MIKINFKQPKYIFSTGHIRSAVRTGILCDADFLRR